MSKADRWNIITPSLSRLVMWGASDQCRVNIPILRRLGCDVHAFIDDTVDKCSPLGEVPIYRGEHGLDIFLKGSESSELGFIIAIGNPHGAVRLRLHALMLARGLRPVSFADPTALVCQSAIFGEGLQVMPAAIIHNDVRIGQQCIVNTRALVEHDCVLEDGVEIGPGAVLCGRVHIGNRSWIGANTTILPRVRIGSNTVIGAGAVVVTDIPNDSVALGVPARVTRDNLKNE